MTLGLEGNSPKEEDLEDRFLKEVDLGGSFLMEEDQGGNLWKEGNPGGSFLKEGDLGGIISLSLVGNSQWIILTTHILVTDQQCHSLIGDMLGLTSHRTETRAGLWINARGHFLMAGLEEEELISHRVIKGSLSTAHMLVPEIVSSLKEGQEDQTLSHQGRKRAHTLVITTASVHILVRDSFEKECLVEGLGSLHSMETRVCLLEFIHNMASTHPIQMVVLVSSPKVVGLEDQTLLHQVARGSQDTGNTTSRFPLTNRLQDGRLIDRWLMDDTPTRKVFMQLLVTNMIFIQRGTSSTQRDRGLLNMVSTRDHLHSSSLCVTHD